MWLPGTDEQPEGYGIKNNRQVICYDFDGVIRIGDVVITPLPHKPEKVFLRSREHGDGGEFSAQGLCDVVQQFFDKNI